MTLLRILSVAAVLALMPGLLAAQSYNVTERGLNYTVYAKTNVVNGTNRVSRYTELASGLNFSNSLGQIVPASETISPLPGGGAQAVCGQTKVTFPGDIYEGVLSVTTPDGRVLTSRPLGIAYDDGSNTIFIASLTNAVGYLVGSNQVVYPGAFGPLGDLVCTYRRSGFESDAVFRQQPPSPESVGLDTDTTTIQMVTEFFNTADPQEIPAGGDDWYGLVDSTLKFGKLTMGRGKAFATPATNSTASAARVFKHWIHVGQRKFLVEEIPLADVAMDLSALPQQARIEKPGGKVLKFASNQPRFPASHAVGSDTNQIFLASADFKKEPGFVLDYTTVDSDQSDFTFADGETFFIDGPIYLSGTTTYGSGAVIKFDSNSGDDCVINDGGRDIFPVSGSSPVIFTTMDDDSVGVPIDGSTGNPQINYGLDYYLSTWNAVTNARFFYARLGLYMQDTRVVSHAQFINCDMGIDDTSGDSYAAADYNNGPVTGEFRLGNVLFSQCGVGLLQDSGWPIAVHGEDITVDNCDSFSPDTAFGGMTNCIFTSVNDGTNNLTFHDCAILPSGTGIYETGNRANYYLAPGSPYRNIGTTNINQDLLAEIQTMTTYASQDGGWPDTNGMDLGYHYPTNEDSTYTGVPDWWIWHYFGNYDENGTNRDSQNYTLASDYLNHRDPNTISFTVRLGNQHFNTTNTTGAYMVLGGVPSYEAVLVNDTNFNDTVWSNYDGTVYLHLPLTDGVYQVWVGLKGIASDATPAWMGVNVYLDRVHPVVGITNLANRTVTTPYVQVQGFANEELLGVTYDLSNAVTMVTNQRATITGYFLDTNLLAYTTNYFQCYDLLLTNGVNTVAVHCTDLAGNVATTNFNLTLDYSTAANPTIRLAWPQNGLEICQTNFTLRGWTEDCGAKVVAQIVDTNGDTNVVNGFVERTGAIWVQNLPLAEGTNWVTVWVTNSAGLSSMTNISVVKSDMVLTLDNVTGDLWQSKVSVNGSISDTSAAVWVNGVQGTNYGNGTWSADNVPVSAGGVASFDLSAVPTNSADPSASQQLVKPSELRMDSAHWIIHENQLDDYWDTNGVMSPLPATDEDTYIGTYSGDTGGQYTDFHKHYDPSGALIRNESDELVLDTHFNVVEEVETLTDGTVNTYPGMGTYQMPEELGGLSYPPEGWLLKYDTSTQVKMVEHVGGYGNPGAQAVVEASGGNGTELLVSKQIANPNNLSIDKTNLLVDGLGQELGTDGLAYGKAAVGSQVGMNLVVGVPDHQFGVGGGTYFLNHFVFDCVTPIDRTTIGIGEVVQLNGMPAGTEWSVSGGGTIGPTNGSSSTFTAGMSPTTSTVHAVIRGSELDASFSVLAPSSIIVVSNWDLPYRTTTNPNGSQTGAQTSYLIVIGPTNVSFENAKIRELLPPLTVAWPDGVSRPLVVGGETNSIAIPCEGLGDLITSGLTPISQLFNGTNYLDFSYTYSWQDQYKSDSGWTTFFNLNNPTEFRGADKKCRVIYLGVAGGWQGPY